MEMKREAESLGSLAAWYDQHFAEHGTWPTSRTYASILLRILAWSGWEAAGGTARLVDIACGGGYFADFASYWFSSTCACDLSRVALREARARCGEVILARADAEFLPFRSRSFDVATCLGSLEHFLHPSRALAEIRRVLRPDGRAVILVPTDRIWLQYDPQPTEVVMPEQEWRALFASEGLDVRVALPTDTIDVLQRSSRGSQVFALSPRQDGEGVP